MIDPERHDVEGRMLLFLIGVPFAFVVLLTIQAAVSLLIQH